MTQYPDNMNYDQLVNARAYGIDPKHLFRCPICAGQRWQHRPRMCHGVPGADHRPAKMYTVDATASDFDTERLVVS